VQPDRSLLPSARSHEGGPPTVMSGASGSLDRGKGMHSKNVTFRPVISVRHMHRAKHCMPNSRTMSEGCASRLRVVMKPTMTLRRMPGGRASCRPHQRSHGPWDPEYDLRCNRIVHLSRHRGWPVLVATLHQSRDERWYRRALPMGNACTDARRLATLLGVASRRYSISEFALTTNASYSSSPRSRWRSPKRSCSPMP